MFGFLRKLKGPTSTHGAGLALRERDCHSHILPGIDDGSRTMEESLDMLRLLHDAGARTVVSTSHIYPGRFDNAPELLKSKFADLQQEVELAGIAIDLDLGAEHFLDDSLLARVQRDEVVAFGAERYVLFETPTGGHIPTTLMDVVHTLADRGYTPLMAHVERYGYLRSEEGEELLEDLRAAGAKFQVNRTVGKVNIPGKGSRGQLIARLLERGWVDEVGSDLHRATPEGRPYAC